MNIQEGHFLYFVPPELDGNKSVNKKRYMLVLKVDDNIIEMINVSSIKGKEHKLLYNSNIIIKNYFPLPVPTFAKLDVLYTTNNFKDLTKYIAFNGYKLDMNELLNIKLERYNYIKSSNRTKVINHSENLIKKLNK